MRFIVLVGKDNTGKTRTLKSVIEELVANGAIIENDPRFRRFGSYVSPASAFPVSANKEITILLRYKGKRIGITTYGDTEASLCKKISLFEQSNCDRIIFGSHPGGSSYHYLVNLADHHQYQDFHAIFKIGCVGIQNHPNLAQLRNISDSHAKDEIIKLI